MSENSQDTLEIRLRIFYNFIEVEVYKIEEVDLWTIMRALNI